MENKKDKFRGLLKDYVAGKLSSEEKDSTDDHLKCCQICQTEIIFVRDMYEVMQKIDINLTKLREYREDSIVTNDPVYQKLEEIIYFDPNREQSRYSPRWYITLISQSLQEKMKKRKMTKKEYKILYRMSIAEITDNFWSKGTSLLE